MSTHTTSVRVTAALLGVLLVSCGTSRHIAPSGAQGLTHLVLVIRELPDGTVTHSWQHAEEFDLSRYSSSSNTQRASPRIVLAMRHPRDCDEELLECMRECMSRPLAPGFGHITSGGRKKGGKKDFCSERCRQPYLDCSRLQDLQPQEFTAVDGAVDWLKRNRHSILVGSVVLIAGVAFVVVSAGAGLVVLVPAVILASPTTSRSHFAEVSP